MFDGRPPVVANFVVVEDGSEIETLVIGAGGNQGVLASGSIGKRRFAKHCASVRLIVGRGIAGIEEGSTGNANPTSR